MRWHTKNIHRMLVAQQPLDAKSNKKIKPGPMLPDSIGTGQANAHEQSLYFIDPFYYRTDRSKRLLRVIRNHWRRCLFRLHLAPCPPKGELSFHLHTWN